MPTISFSGLIAVPMPLMLNRSGKSGHFCFILDVKEKAFSGLSLLNVISAGFYRYPLLRKLPPFPSLLRICIRMLDFAKCFFYLY